MNAHRSDQDSIVVHMTTGGSQAIITALEASLAMLRGDDRHAGAMLAELDPDLIDVIVDALVSAGRPQTRKGAHHCAACADPSQYRSLPVGSYSDRYVSLEGQGDDVVVLRRDGHRLIAMGGECNTRAFAVKVGEVAHRVSPGSEMQTWTDEAMAVTVTALAR